MKNFEFKSAICTSVEQSKRLLELGLKPETADMWHIAKIKDWRGNDIPKRNQKWWLSFDGIGVGVGFDQFERVPAWSLSRLIELCEPIPISCDWLYRTDAYYENMIACIAWRISKEYFNPQFLEEKKC